MNSCFSDPSHTGPNVFADHPFPLLQTPISTLPPNTKVRLHSPLAFLNNEGGSVAKQNKTLSLTQGNQTTCFHRMASEMVNIHNVIIRGLNSIYLQARSIPPADHGSFAHYMHQWHRLLDAHHAGEEHTFFPAVERLAGEAGIMGANVDQHRAFHDGMERFGAYALACVRGEVVFSGEEVVRIVDSFGGPLTEHLSAEIQSLLDLERFGEEKMAGMEKSAAEEAETAMVSPGFPRI